MGKKPETNKQKTSSIFPAFPPYEERKTSISLRVLIYFSNLKSYNCSLHKVSEESYEEGWEENRFNVNLSSCTRKKCCRKIF